MKAVLLAGMLAIGTIQTAEADFWFDPPAGFGVPNVPPEYRGGPYYVAGFGSEPVFRTEAVKIVIRHHRHRSVVRLK